eukprot:11597332-Heterocapsa_arctica.AAC.1
MSSGCRAVAARQGRRAARRSRCSAACQEGQCRNLSAVCAGGGEASEEGEEEDSRNDRYRPYPTSSPEGAST